MKKSEAFKLVIYKQKVKPVNIKLQFYKDFLENDHINHNTMNSSIESVQYTVIVVKISNTTEEAV